MKINNGYQDARAASAQETAKAQETGAAQSRSTKGAGSAGKSSAADEVSLSSLASALKGALSDSPERAAYLEALASDYAAGTYQPDAQETAKAIVRETLGNPADPEKGQ